MAGIVEIIIGILNLLPAGRHAAVCRIHVIAVGTVTEPPGEHLAVGVEIVVTAVNLLPSGAHLAVAAEHVPAVLDLPRAVYRAFAVIRIKIVPAVIHVHPAGCHGTAVAQVIKDVVNAYPAGVHGTVGQQVVILAVILDPASCHHAVALEVVPFIVDLLPANRHLSGG